MNPPEPFESWHEHLTVALPGAQVVFTTRRGGFSGGPFESLNLGRLTPDESHNTERNRRHLQGLIGRPLAMAHQVHETTIHRVNGDWPGLDAELGTVPQGDGLLTDGGEVAPAVLVADCLPVALAGGGIVAMLHAGWRGLAGGILRQGVELMRDQGVTGPIHAAVGPGIGVCCYEVGEEVHQAFGSYGAAVRRGSRLDLPGVARIQLARAGVEQVHELGLCTSCSPELFFSHRRDHGTTGRQAGVIWSG